MEGKESKLSSLSGPMNEEDREECRLLKRGDTTDKSPTKEAVGDAKENEASEQLDRDRLLLKPNGELSAREKDRLAGLSVKSG